MNEKTRHPQLERELKQVGIIKKMPLYLNVGGVENEIMVFNFTKKFYVIYYTTVFKYFLNSSLSFGSRKANSTLARKYPSFDPVS